MDAKYTLQYLEEKILSSMLVLSQHFLLIKDLNNNKTVQTFADLISNLASKAVCPASRLHALQFDTH